MRAAGHHQAGSSLIRKTHIVTDNGFIHVHFRQEKEVHCTRNDTVFAHYQVQSRF